MSICRCIYICICIIYLYVYFVFLCVYRPIVTKEAENGLVSTHTRARTHTHTQTHRPVVTKEAEDGLVGTSKVKPIHCLHHLLLLHAKLVLFHHHELLL